MHFSIQYFTGLLLRWSDFAAFTNIAQIAVRWYNGGGDGELKGKRSNDIRDLCELTLKTR